MHAIDGQAFCSSLHNIALQKLRSLRTNIVYNYSVFCKEHSVGHEVSVTFVKSSCELLDRHGQEKCDSNMDNADTAIGKTFAEEIRGSSNTSILDAF